jgi:hypothetical protein
LKVRMSFKKEGFKNKNKWGNLKGQKEGMGIW